MKQNASDASAAAGRATVTVNAAATLSASGLLTTYVDSLGASSANELSFLRLRRRLCRALSLSGIVSVNGAALHDVCERGNVNENAFDDGRHHRSLRRLYGTVRPVRRRMRRRATNFLPPLEGGEGMVVFGVVLCCSDWHLSRSASNGTATCFLSLGSLHKVVDGM